jgi:hypothetical protein
MDRLTCLVGLTIAAGVFAADNSALCHADILIKDLDFATLTDQEKAVLGPKLAKTIALQNGMGQRDIMSPTYQSGTVGFYSGSYMAPWSPPNRKPYTAGSATIVSSLISGCAQASMMLGVLKNPAVHDSITNTIEMSITGSGAIIGRVTVLGVSVEPEKKSAPPQAVTGSVSALPAPTSQNPGTDQTSSGTDQTSSGGWLIPSLTCLGASAVVGVGAWLLLQKKMGRGLLGGEEDEEFYGH